MATQKNIIGGWYAVNNGQEAGKHLEMEVQEVTTDKGGRFQQMKIYKPFVGIDRETNQQKWMQSGWLPTDKVSELIDRVNYFIKHFSSVNGQYVFQPDQVTQVPGGFPQGQGVGQAAPQGYAAPVNPAPVASPPLPAQATPGYPPAPVAAPAPGHEHYAENPNGHPHAPIGTPQQAAPAPVGPPAPPYPPQG